MQKVTALPPALKVVFSDTVQSFVHYRRALLLRGEACQQPTGSGRARPSSLRSIRFSIVLV